MNVSPYFTGARITRSSLKASSGLPKINSLHAKITRGKLSGTKSGPGGYSSADWKGKRRHVKVENEVPDICQGGEDPSRHESLGREEVLEKNRVMLNLPVKKETFEETPCGAPHEVKVKTETHCKEEVEQSHDNVDQKKMKWEPPLWRKQLENIYTMRKNRDAPVDTMGCDVISDATAAPEVCEISLYIKVRNLYIKVKNLYIKVRNLYIKGRNLYIKVRNLYIKVRNLYIKGSNLYIKVRNLYIKVRNLYIKVRNLYIKVRNLYIKVRNLYIKVRNLYIKVRNLYIKVRNLYIKVRNLYIKVRNLYIKVRNLYIKVRNLYIKVRNLYIKV